MFIITTVRSAKCSASQEVETSIEFESLFPARASPLRERANCTASVNATAPATTSDAFTNADFFELELICITGRFFYFRKQTTFGPVWAPLFCCSLSPREEGRPRRAALTGHS